MRIIFLIYFHNVPTQEMFNSTSDITICSPLPHYVNPDIILCLDEQNQLVPSEKFLSSFSPEEIKYVDKKKTANNVKWVALVMASYGLVIRSTNLPIGLLAARIRQLSIIGYTPVVVSLMEEDNKRLDLLRIEM